MKKFVSLSLAVVVFLFSITSALAMPEISPSPSSSNNVVESVYNFEIRAVDPNAPAPRNIGIGFLICSIASYGTNGYTLTFKNMGGTTCSNINVQTFLYSPFNDYLGSQSRNVGSLSQYMSCVETFVNPWLTAPIREVYIVFDYWADGFNYIGAGTVTLW